MERIDFKRPSSPQPSGRDGVLAWKAWNFKLKNRLPDVSPLLLSHECEGTIVTFLLHHRVFIYLHHRVELFLSVLWSICCKLLLGLWVGSSSHQTAWAPAQRSVPCRPPRRPRCACAPRRAGRPDPDLEPLPADPLGLGAGLAVPGWIQGWRPNTAESHDTLPRPQQDGLMVSPDSCCEHWTLPRNTDCRQRNRRYVGVWCGIEWSAPGLFVRCCGVC